MENRERKIYWREEIKSYLPKFNSLFVENFFRMELSIFVQGIKDGKILDLEEFDKRFRYQTEPDEKGRIITKTKPEAAGFYNDFTAMQPVEKKLLEIFGIWTKHFRIYAIIYNGYRDRNPNIFSAQHLERMVQTFFNSLKKVHEETDIFLKKMNEVLPAAFLKSDTDFVNYAGNKVLHYTIQENTDGFEDRWFGKLPLETTIFLESLGIMVDEKAVHDISGRHFGSWIEPDDDAIASYLDELKGIEAQKIFDAHYGKS